MLKSNLLTAALERGFVHIDPDYISVQQLCLNKSGPASANWSSTSSPSRE